MTKKKIIFAIVGESGSGKTTLADHVTATLGIKTLESHTDRPKRSEGEQGHTFHTSESFDKLNTDDFVAYTKFGDYRYCCLKSDLNDVNLYLIDEVGLEMLDKEKYDVVAVRVWCLPSVLVNRASEERRSRDAGRFAFFRPWYLERSKYDAYVDTSCKIETSQQQMIDIVKDFTDILLEPSPFDFLAKLEEQDKIL